MEVHLAWRFTRIFGRAVDNFTSEKIRELGHNIDLYSHAAAERRFG
jgi:hypothetical protein